MENKILTANGIEIFSYPNGHTHSFCLSLYIRAGALYESDEENGITHFLEHILFRNINHRMDGQLYRRLDQLGLFFNGATYKEFIQLYIIGAPRHFAEAADILLKAFEPLTLPADQIRTEQQRVKAEIREAGDFKTLDYFAGTLCWKDTSLRNTILGTKGNVSTFSRRKLAAYHSQAFCPENLFFYVTGCVSEADLSGLAEQVSRLGPLSKGVRRDNRAPVPEGFGVRDLLIGVKNSPYTMVQFSYDLITEKYSGAELALLYDVLFSGENSLMHQELSEKRGMIYSYASTLEKYNNIGRIYFAYEVAARDLYPSIEVVRDGLTRLELDMADRLSLVLPEYTDNAYMIYDDNEGFNWQRAYEGHIMNGRERSIEESRNAYLAVTPGRLSQIAAEIFTADNLVLSLKGNQKKIDPDRIRRIFGKEPQGEKVI